VRFFAVGFTNEFGVQMFDVRVLVRTPKLFVIVYGVKCLGAAQGQVGIQRVVVERRVGLAASHHAPAGAGHDFHKVIFLFAALD